MLQFGKLPQRARGLVASALFLKDNALLVEEASMNASSLSKIVLDGEIQGDVRCVSLVLGENSQLEGGVIAEEVVIHGRLIGSVRARRVTLQSMCHVEGELLYQTLVVERGAFFEGKARRAEDPLKAQGHKPLSCAVSSFCPRDNLTGRSRPGEAA